jgi:hypothetical protein
MYTNIAMVSQTTQDDDHIKVRSLLCICVLYHMCLITFVLQQHLLAALDQLSKYQSDEQIIQALTVFMDPILAAVAEFAKLENKHMQEPHDTVGIRKKFLSKLSQFVTAKDTKRRFTSKDTRGRFAAIGALCLWDC